MAAKGDDPAVHFIRDGRFVCTAPPTAPCRNYPACSCETWDPDLHGEVVAPGHEDVPQDECWMAPWLTSTDLCDQFEQDIMRPDEEFPDGAITVEFEWDECTWAYADGRVLTDWQEEDE